MEIGKPTSWVLKCLKNCKNVTLITYNLKSGPSPNGTFIQNTRLERLEEYKLKDSDHIILSNIQRGVTLEICSIEEEEVKPVHLLSEMNNTVSKKPKLVAESSSKNNLIVSRNNEEFCTDLSSAHIITKENKRNNIKDEQYYKDRERLATEWALKFMEILNTPDSDSDIVLENSSVADSIEESCNVQEEKKLVLTPKIVQDEAVVMETSAPFSETIKNTTGIITEDQEAEDTYEINSTMKKDFLLKENVQCAHKMYGPDSLYTVNYKYFLEAISSICEWNTNWLHESTDFKDKDRLTKPLPKVKDHFDSVQDYLSTFKPLFLYEIWIKITQSYNIYKSQISNLSSCIFYESSSNTPLFSIKVKCLDKEFTTSSNLLDSNNAPLWCLSCVGEFDKKNIRHGPNNLRLPDVGDLLLLTMTSDDKLIINTNDSKTSDKRKKTVFFAYTDAVISNTFQNKEAKKTQILFKLLITEKSHSIPNNTFINFLCLFHVCPELRLFQAICSMKTSPLCDAIVMPALYKNSINNFPVSSLLNNPNNLDFNQKGAVSLCTRLALSDNPNICLINGYPGTGKTHVIINIIRCIMTTKQCSKYTKLLLCTYSNSAVDELAQRLLDIKEKNPDLNFVKIGQKHSSISLSALVKQKMDKLDEKVYVKKLLENLNNTLREMNIIKCQNESIVDSLLENEIKKTESYIQCLSSEKHPLKKMLIKKYLETEILSSANVIIATLNSCLTKPMENLFMPSYLLQNKNHDYFTCIVEETELSFEPLSLLPVLFGINKIILVGNCKLQNPIERSETTNENGLNHSLIKRLISWHNKNIESDISKIPVITLDMQYRMHKEISNFPSRYFYNNAIKNSATVLKSNRPPLQPYLLLDHTFSHNIADDINENEAKLIANIVKVLITRIQNLSITIAVLSENQHKTTKIIFKKILPSSLNERMTFQILSTNCLYDTECDVLIMSTACNYKLFIDEAISCTALTRARHSLFICGNFKHFQTNPFWKHLVADAQERNLVRRIYEKTMYNLDDLHNVIKL
ncbi:uncharacterized protein LOC126846220 isoform X2 [Adelges cooleyi]|uniref:uncharacterized protein LOC126846220 isoform X2 n=1 Tax=Adelges cooleyi TaxID=133065 RepID=UPI0021801D11|nr:uncharacterized protein LOC126846220 isoform X2 [Adelges cooleyi]